jgi:RNA polymerase sigma-70 factor, ECF subfamily
LHPLPADRGCNPRRPARVPPQEEIERLSAREDEEDVRRVLAGETEAFAGIVRRWQGPLVSLAFRFSRDPSAAEEMAQEAFLKAYRALAHWRGEGAFSTWLFALATNVFRSWLRRRRPPGLPLEAAGGVAAPGGREDREDRLETAERERLVRRAVAALPERFRDAILLFYFHDMDLKAAAASLGLPEGTVKSHLHRGRALLERRLGGALDPARRPREEQKEPAA